MGRGLPLIGGFWQGFSVPRGGGELLWKGPAPVKHAFSQVRGPRRMLLIRGGLLIKS